MVAYTVSASSNADWAGRRTSSCAFHGYVAQFEEERKPDVPQHHLGDGVLYPRIDHGLSTQLPRTIHLVIDCCMLDTPAFPRAPLSSSTQQWPFRAEFNPPPLLPVTLVEYGRGRCCSRRPVGSSSCFDNCFSNEAGGSLNSTCNKM